MNSFLQSGPRCRLNFFISFRIFARIPSTNRLVIHADAARKKKNESNEEFISLPVIRKLWQFQMNIDANVKRQTTIDANNNNHTRVVISLPDRLAQQNSRKEVHGQRGRNNFNL